MFIPSHPVRKQMHTFNVRHREIHAVRASDKRRVIALTRRIAELVEPLLADNVHGYRKGHSIHTAVAHVESMQGERLAFDIRSYFESIDKQRLKRLLDRLDPTLWHQVDLFLGSNGLRTGPNFCPVLSNLYLAEIDHRFPYVRYCDNFMLVCEEPFQQFRRLEKQLGDIGLTCHQVQEDPLKFLNQPLKEVQLV